MCVSRVVGVCIGRRGAEVGGAESESSKASNSRKSSVETTYAHVAAVSDSNVAAYDRGVCDGVNRDDYF